MTSLVVQMVKRLPTMQETQVRSLGWEDPLGKKMATHSSTLGPLCVPSQVPQMVVLGFRLRHSPTAPLPADAGSQAMALGPAQPQPPPGPPELPGGRGSSERPPAACLTPPLAHV